MIDLTKKAYTQISETLAPQADKNHPVTEQEFVKGGHQQFKSLSERNVFPMERRAKSMTCSIEDVNYILLDNLTTWAPFDRGYLVLNPKKSQEVFYFVVPYHFIILSETAKEAVIVQGLTNGTANEKKTIILSGSPGAVVTYEVARILNPLEAGLSYSGVDYSAPLNNFLTEVETAKNEAVAAAQVSTNAAAASQSAANLAEQKANAINQKMAEADLLYSAAESHKIIAAQKAQEAINSAAGSLQSSQNSLASAQASEESANSVLGVLEQVQNAEQSVIQNNEESATNAFNADVSAQQALDAKEYLENQLFHFISEDETSVTFGIGTQVLISQSTSGLDSVILEIHTP